MKRLISGLVALFLFAVFWMISLANGLPSFSVAVITASGMLLIWLFFAVKRKSVFSIIAGFVSCTIVMYLIWGVNFLVAMVMDLLNSTILNYIFIIVFSLISILILRKIWKFLSGIYVIVKPDEAHVVTRIDKTISVYSGTDISDRASLEDLYKGNHYWNFSHIKILKMVLGMVVQKTRFDDLKIEIKDVKVKSKNKAELIIGKAVFHFRVYNPITVAKIWPGDDMDIAEFKKEIYDIVEEAIEVSVVEFTARQLTGGSKKVNLAFKEELIDKLEGNYGIEIINAKLSQEKGEIIDLVKKIQTEKLRRKSEVAKQDADTAIEVAKEKKQQKINAVMKAEADGRKRVVEINAEAESQRIRKILQAQASDKDMFLATHPMHVQENIAKALAGLYQNATTIVNSGGSQSVIGEILALGKSLGISGNSIKAIADK